MAVEKPQTSNHFYRNLPMIWDCVVLLAMTAHKSHPLCNKGLKKAEKSKDVDYK